MGYILTIYNMDMKNSVLSYELINYTTPLNDKLHNKPCCYLMACELHTCRPTIIYINFNLA